MSLVDIEYHPPCPEHGDGEHRQRPGYYACKCGASMAWHETKPVEPDYAAATAKLVEQGPSDFSDENVAHNVVNAALEIGDTDE